LFPTLSRDNIVVPMKVQRALAITMKTQHVVPRAIRIAWHLHHAVCETEVIQLRANPVHAVAVVIPGRILTGDCDEVAAKCQERLLVDIESLFQRKTEIHAHPSIQFRGPAHVGNAIANQGH